MQDTRDGAPVTPRVLGVTAGAAVRRDVVHSCGCLPCPGSSCFGARAFFRPDRHGGWVTSLPMPSSVRAARIADRDPIIDVARASGLFSTEELADVAATLDAFLSGTADHDRWLIEDMGVGAAAVAYYAPERMTEGTWNLYLLAVHPDHQSRGRGAALVRHVERHLRHDGARVLLIETSGVAEFAGQRAFYAGLGYHEEARIRDFYQTGDDKVVFGKRLSSADPAEDGSTGGSPRIAEPGQHLLRVARGEDLAALRRLAEDFYREDGFSTGPDALAANLRQLIHSDAAHIVVVDQSDELMGFAITTTSFGLENGLIAELEDLYIPPVNRRQGLATRLIDDATAWARDRGCTKLEVVLAPNDQDVTHLHAYYETHGFRDDGRRLRSRDLD